ncbi:MAG: cell surface protein SprA [Candidatus Symbiothrix sp.]|jgi:cell surface protein SprA|nr:cell surface protein SprA [Candidatus Symbiothrix sp.]
MESGKKYIFTLIFLASASGFSGLSSPQAPPPKAATQSTDTANTIFPIAKTVPEEYRDVKNVYPIDLSMPQNFKSDFEYNPLTNLYELRTKIGNEDIETPLTLTPEEYYKYSLQRSRDLFYRNKYTAEFDSMAQKKEKDALSAFDFNVNIGPADKIFGPGGVRLNASGSLTTKVGFTHTSTGNPTLTERQRNHTAFDFDTQIQTDIKASVGDKLNFDLNYNTESTFDFDTKKLKLGYNGKEDEIVKVLEAGNVSMNTTNSLIRGGAALFGIKTQLQFGKLTVDAVFSQQESQSRSISTQGNVQTTPFEVAVDKYDENRYYFLAHYFYNRYDEAMSTLPYIKSPISIDKIEVWITNRRSDFSEARNIVAFTDLAEHRIFSNPDFTFPTSSDSVPYNGVNNLYNNIVNNYSGVRDVSTVNQVLTGHLENGLDYEKIENARKLDPSEYTFNPQLGYISLRYPLQSDEVLAVAYSYVYKGVTYQVGEFSTDNPNDSQSNLYVKLIKGTTVSPSAKTWKLMMRNVYAVTTYNQSLTSDNFRLNIKYLNDTTGAYLNYITEGAIANHLLLRVVKLDRLNSRNESSPDGFFDFVPGLTVKADEGKIIFPVIEPFGSHLRKMIGDDRIADKYVFQELYDSTLTIAQQTAEKNKFILTGEYKGSNASNINLDGMITKGSVTVSANGVQLKENVDYTVNYATGQVTIINPLYENANIQTSSEDQAAFGLQRKTMMGLNLNYAVNKQFNIGTTLMNLSEMPLTMKTEPGQESINNTLFGFNVNYATQSQWLTNVLDKIPLLELTEPSQITLTAEYARLIPGHYKSKYGGNYSYIDDFEQAKQIVDLRSPYAWSLASTPTMFEESAKSNNTDYGKNRSLLAWYHIDALFTRKSSLTPTHIKNDLDQLSDHYVREIPESELYPDKDPTFGESATIPILNLAYYPRERGPYNLDALGMNPNGTLSEPEKRWGGITRRIESGNTDFEANNIETLEFWLLDPFIGNENARGGDLYFNLGEISEDILKDEKKFFENGMPIDGDSAKVTKTAWGLVPQQQSLVYAFENADGARARQDVGLDGLPTEQEFTFNTYADYLTELDRVLSPETRESMIDNPFSPYNDPAGDNYHYFRGSDYDARQLPILDRYKHYNGVEGNSADASTSPENYSTAARLVPDVEDINQDNTLNETEKYFQYRVAIRPDSMVVGKNFIVQKMEVKPYLKNGKSETVNWYQFKIPISEYEGKIGNISDFKTIRFVRMFLTDFSDSVILRFGTLQFDYGQWRIYQKDLFDPKLPPAGSGTISMSTVNIEESGSKEPVNYVMPPGVNRILDPGQTQLRQQNEQSMSLRINNLSQGDARAIYKSTGLDTRQYRRLQMFVHAEKLIDLPTDLQDNELSVFIRLGSDYKSHYYEYEVPLTLTPPNRYIETSESRRTVWPESNMIDFPFELLTDLKLERNREKRKAGSTVTYYTPFSIFDPEKPMNKVSVVGNPTISNIKVIMIGVRNNSRATQSAEVWVNELRLTDFNEDGGWAGNANLYVGLSNMGSIGFSGRKETAGFGSLDQGIMDRNIDDVYQYNIASQIDLGRFFPEKAKINLPLYYSYTEDVVSPKYNPMDQDVLLKDALDATATQAERDSIQSFAQNRKTVKSISFNNVRADIRSKRPMPYDPANFSFDWSHVENYMQDATTQYEQTIAEAVNLNYSFSPMFKAWKPFAKNSSNKSEKTEKTAGQARSKTASARSNGGGFLQNIEIGYLPKSLDINLERTRNYYEVQLRDLGESGVNMIPPSFRDDFYWNRSLKAQWSLTKNLNLSFNSGTNARIETLKQLTEDNLTPDDEYLKQKKSVWKDLRDLGEPMEYKQTFSATYALPFNLIPALNFIKGSLTFNSGYNWEKGALLTAESDGETEDVEMGNIINNNRTIGIENIQFDLLSLYNKSQFLADANKKFTGSKGLPSRNAGRRTGNTNANPTGDAKKTESEKKKKKYEGSVTLMPDSAAVVAHQLNNSRLRITARDENGKLYPVKYKTVDNNSIRIQGKDSVNLKIVISQLPPLDDETWYKTLQYAARGLMMVRSIGFSYNEGTDMMIPNFQPTVGNFFGQGSTPFGSAPGVAFAFGLAGENYIEKAKKNKWLMENEAIENNITPSTLNKTGTFTFTANLEPVVGLRIVLNATRTRSDRQQTYFMYGNDLNTMPKKFTGDFKMTTISIGTAFESSSADNGYRSKAFDAFLNNRDMIADRLRQVYSRTTYPDAGFLQGDPLAGQPFDPQNGNVDINSTDVLIPAFIAAYTGQDAKSTGLSAFPSLTKLLPNWKITYDGLLQIPVINKHFKAFTIEHNYTSVYSVGAFNSFLSWVGTEDDDIGFIQNVTSNRPYPSSPYDITAVSIVEAFNPLLGINSTLQNNMSISLKYNTNRNINLNVSAYQIVESKTKTFTVGTGYRFENFNRILKIRKTGGPNFNNELNIKADISYNMTQNLIRKIQDNLTQATNGNTQTMIKLSADYNLSRLITLQAFFDKQISNPLVSATAYPVSKSSFGISVRVSLMR